jgi:hypothetical protein
MYTKSKFPDVMDITELKLAIICDLFIGYFTLCSFLNC